MAATAAAMLKGAWTNKHIKASHNIHELGSKQVNIVHIRRPEAAVSGVHPSQLVAKPTLQVVIDAHQPAPALEHLLQHVLQPELQQQLHRDLQQVVQQISTVQQTDHLRAKLEIISRQSCPNFHADSVGIRCLCTYAGPGTCYVENRHVTRKYNPWTGDASIITVDAQQAVQTAAGDLLYLKGNMCSGMLGAAAVHKSPEVVDDSYARLLLTVDDACCHH